MNQKPRVTNPYSIKRQVMKLDELITKLQILKDTHGGELPVILVGKEDECQIVGAFDDEGMDCTKWRKLTPTHIYLEG